MKLEGEGKLLRIFLGETDHLKHQPLYEVIVMKARELGLAGATVYRGMLSYGANTRIHRVKMLELSEDLPIIIEIVDTEDNIQKFLPALDELITETNCGGLITIERADIIRYFHEKK